MILVHAEPPVYYLNPQQVEFPDPLQGAGDEPIAIGGSLLPHWLLHAYRSGIFPWFSEDGLPYWYSPDPRMILPLTELSISRSTRKFLRRSTWEIRFDTHFIQIISQCANTLRPGQKGTWISEDFIDAYSRLHDMGYGHCVGVYENGLLIGGLYGLSLGKVFFGESMFSQRDNASKTAMIALVKHLRAWGFDFVDCQIPSEHLKHLGAQEVSRRQYFRLLEQSLEEVDRVGKWNVICHASELITGL